MVEKITVNPESIRAYGNIITPKTSTDFSLYGEDYKIIESTDTVNGEQTTVYGIESIYTLTFDSASYTTSGSVSLTVTVMEGTSPVNSGTVYVTGAGGSGSGILTLGGGGVVNITVTGITESGTLTATYENAKATVPVTYEQSSYSLAFSQDTYTCDMMDGVTVSCTLTNGGVAMSGETVTFSWESMGLPNSVTATTNSSGVATHAFDYWDFNYPATLTATYSGVTATCTITSDSGGGLID